VSLRRDRGVPRRRCPQSFECQRRFDPRCVARGRPRCEQNRREI